MITFPWLSFCLRFGVMDSHFIPRDDALRRVFIISFATGQQNWKHLFPHRFVIVSYDSWNRTLKYHKVPITLYTLLLDTKKSAEISVVVTRVTFWMSSSACWSNAWVTAAVDRPERRAPLSPVINKAKRLRACTFLPACEYLLPFSFLTQ